MILTILHGQYDMLHISYVSYGMVHTNLIGIALLVITRFM